MPFDVRRNRRDCSVNSYIMYVLLPYTFRVCTNYLCIACFYSMRIFYVWANLPVLSYVLPISRENEEANTTIYRNYIHILFHVTRFVRKVWQGALASCDTSIKLSWNILLISKICEHEELDLDD